LHQVQNGQKAFLTSALIKYSAAYAAYVAFLHAVDGPWRHWKDGREGAAVDPWTGQHVLWGTLGSFMGLTPKQILILGTVNELVELGVRTYRPDLLWGSPESPQNVFFDLMASLVGWELGELLTGNNGRSAT
jgi:hypothetical protein